MAQGHHSDGARRLDELMSHLTQPKFIWILPARKPWR
jgi:hypothetical protein